MGEDGHGDDLVLAFELDAAHACEFAALEHAHVGDWEADGLPLRRGQQHVLVLVADRNADDAVALVELHGDLAVLPDLDEVGELVAPDGAAVGGEHHVELGPARLVLRQRQDGGDVLVLGKRQEVDQRLAARLRRGDRRRHTFIL